MGEMALRKITLGRSIFLTRTLPFDVFSRLENWCHHSKYCEKNWFSNGFSIPSFRSDSSQSTNSHNQYCFEQFIEAPNRNRIDCILGGKGVFVRSTAAWLVLAFARCLPLQRRGRTLTLAFDLPLSRHKAITFLRTRIASRNAWPRAPCFHRNRVIAIIMMLRSAIVRNVIV